MPAQAGIQAPALLLRNPNILIPALAGMIPTFAGMTGYGS
jgi:hypothetical protein